MLSEDKAYLWDIISAAEDVVNFVKDMSSDEFAKDKRTRFAVG